MGLWGNFGFGALCRVDIIYDFRGFMRLGGTQLVEFILGW